MKRHERAYWQRAVDRFERQGLTQEEFCAAHELNAGTFRSWLYRLRREAQTPEAAFVEVVSQSMDTVAAVACVVRIGSAEVRFGERPDAVYLGALLAAAAGDER